MMVIKMTRMDSHSKLSGLHCQTTALYALSLSEPQSDRCANTISLQSVALSLWWESWCIGQGEAKMVQ